MRQYLVPILWALCGTLSAAEIDSTEFGVMKKIATDHGYTPVVVSFHGALGIRDLKKSAQNFFIDRENELRMALGLDHIANFHKSNGAGQLTLLVKPNGLDKLKHHSSVASAKIFPSKFPYYTGGNEDELEKIWNEIRINGQAEIEIMPDIDEGEFDIKENGKTTFHHPTKWPEELLNLTEKFNSKAGQNLTRKWLARAKRDEKTPLLSSWVDEEALFEVLQDPIVRFVKIGLTQSNQ